MRETLAVVFFICAVSVFFYSCWRVGKIHSHMRMVVNERLGKEAFLNVRGFNQELSDHFRAFSPEGDDSLKQLRLTQVMLVLSFVAAFAYFL